MFGRFHLRLTALCGWLWVGGDVLKRVRVVLETVGLSVMFGGVEEWRGKGAGGLDKGRCPWCERNLAVDPCGNGRLWRGVEGERQQVRAENEPDWIGRNPQEKGENCKTMAGVEDGLEKSEEGSFVSRLSFCRLESEAVSSWLQDDAIVLDYYE